MKNSEEGLIGKAVMNKQGIHIGTIKKLAQYDKKGKSILVSPCDNIRNKNFPHTTHGEVIIPIKSIKSVKDIVVIE